MDLVRFVHDIYNHNIHKNTITNGFIHTMYQQQQQQQQQRQQQQQQQQQQYKEEKQDKPNLFI
ncbi:hypothetical protein DFA_07134 [Cavenderia fasciculata]|uniref:Uncharacterized protein n=1 Tax=Cavenderia fasciculata TaxID=261658 RepID=F4PVK4_CACFS|nr:uncharacterized protein DFA_07134 [Cavenderia fasciculata]EGG20018.1 hypothetical protein DFA_07134 [Cavenderia fasciculata]|eukprot:XP_004367001.1 hypothetical protein DFA_07134 [Cavenderia fasciculata]